jgi:hypothetical protein
MSYWPEFNEYGEEIFDLSQQSFDIKNELIVRKKLEKNTSWDIEFNKNDNPFEYDLVYYKWLHHGERLSKTLIGYVEIEYCFQWTGDPIPNKFYEASFLKRKIYKWVNDDWGDPKENYEKTIYLKFNREYTNCFSATISDLIENGYLSQRSDGSYHNTFIALSWESWSITVGLDPCMEKINKFMDSILDAEK